MVIEVASVRLGELTAKVVAVWTGRDGATVVSAGLIALSGVAGWTDPQVPTRPVLSVLTRYSSFFCAG